MQKVAKNFPQDTDKEPIKYALKYVVMPHFTSHTVKSILRQQDKSIPVSTSKMFQWCVKMFVIFIKTNLYIAEYESNSLWRSRSLLSSVWRIRQLQAISYLILKLNLEYCIAVNRHQPKLKFKIRFFTQKPLRFKTLKTHNVKIMVVTSQIIKLASVNWNNFLLCYNFLQPIECIQPFL